jgi:hypothetical protein
MASSDFGEFSPAATAMWGACLPAGWLEDAAEACGGG